MGYPRPETEPAFPPWCILHHHLSTPRLSLGLSQQTIPHCSLTLPKTPERDTGHSVKNLIRKKDVYFLVLNNWRRTGKTYNKLMRVKGIRKDKETQTHWRQYLAKASLAQDFMKGELLSCNALLVRDPWWSMRTRPIPETTIQRPIYTVSISLLLFPIDSTLLPS